MKHLAADRLRLQLGGILREMREQARMSRPELGKLIGVHRNTIERYEQGFDVPVVAFVAICTALEMKPGRILDELGRKEQ